MQNPQQVPAITSMLETLATYQPAADHLEQLADEWSVTGKADSSAWREAEELAEMADIMLRAVKSAVAENTEDADLNALFGKVLAFSRQIRGTLDQLESGIAVTDNQTRLSAS